MKKLITILIISLFFIYHTVEADTNIPQTIIEELNKQASIPIPSPNVAALNKFVEFPVSIFNGQMNISIPIYEIKLKDISLPITLKYHTGGIRVNEEASWVGLGWVLDAGGVITHQINGKDDLTSLGMYTYYGQYFPYTTEAKNKTYYEGITSTYVSCLTVPKENGQLENISVIDGLFYPDYQKINGEPDLYVYSIGNYSGKFINWQNEQKDLSCNNIKFKQYVGNVHTADSIIAITPEGIIYKFKDIESNFSLTGVSSQEQNNMRMNTGAYYLSEIITPNGEHIKFNYKTFKQLITENHWESNYPDYSYGTYPSYMQAGYYPSVPALFEDCSMIYYRQSSQVIEVHSTKLRSYTFTQTLFLDKIEFPNGIIEFVKSPRLDAYGVKLDKIYVKNTLGQKIKTFRFEYGYFEGLKPSTGCDATTATNVSLSANLNYPENYLKKRLKLTSLIELDNINENKTETYSFSYNENINLPYKTSFAQDFWGFYNAQTANKTLIPSYQLYASELGMGGFGGGYFETLTTANRNIDKSAITADVLKEIVYPTGGKTSFEFEPNECINSFLSDSEIETKYYSAIDTGEGYKYVDLIFNEKKKVNIDVMLLKGNSQVTYNTINTASLGEHFEYSDAFYAQIEKYDNSRNKWVLFDLKYFWNAAQLLTGPNATQYFGSFQNEELPAGKYRMTANFPDQCANLGSLGSTMADIYISYDTLITKPNNYVGGLRIKKVTKIDPISNKSIIKNFQYNNGILTTRPDFISKEICSNPHYDGINDTQVFGLLVSLNTNPIFPYSFSANGSLVGYKNISERNSDGEFGRIEYEYKISPDYVGINGLEIQPSGMPPISNLSNGFLTKMDIYDSSNQAPLQKHSYQYSFINPTVYWGFKVNYPAVFDKSGAVSSPTIRASDGEIIFYPIIQGKTAIKSEYIEDYRQGVVPPIQTTTNYEYNNYGFLFSKKTKDSYGKTYNEIYKYVPDMQNETYLYTLMTNKNIVNPIIEHTTDHNSSIITLRTNYSVQGNNYKPSNVQIKIGNNPMETRLTYDRYDEFGDPIVITKDEGDRIVYLWSYNYQYPVAEIKNATFTEVETAIKEKFLINNLTEFSTLPTPDEPKLKDGTLQRALPNALVTTYTYKPLVGMTSKTDPRGVTTYYEYDSFNRLKSIKDKDGKIIQSFEYNYKH